MHKLGQSRREDNRIDAASLQIRLAGPDDVPAIAAIFNHAIEHTTASFYTRPRTVAQQMAWLQERGDRFPVLVAEADSRVVGWVSLDRWNQREGYRITGELAFYVDPEYHRRGIGRRLVQQITDAARERGFCNLIAKIAEGNEASLRLVESLGFAQVGRLQGVGEKFGKRRDVFYFQKQI